MVATILITIITALMSNKAWKEPAYMHKWIFNPYAIQQRKEYWRFITSGMIHKDMTHLLVNMITFFSFGGILESIYIDIYGPMGSLYFVGIYFLTMVLADIPDFFKYKNTYHYNALGASGAVAAIMFGRIFFDPTKAIYLFMVIPIPGFIAAIMFVMYSLYQRKHGNDMIGHDVHLYGALFGFISSFLIAPQLLPDFVNMIVNYKPF